MAVASAGGHWIQLERLSPAFIHHNVRWVSTNHELASRVPFGTFSCVRDANIWAKQALVITALQIGWQVLKFRPHAVVTTGAAPGYFAILFGRLFGARTIWIDSLANSEELSMAGKKVSALADYWFTQWPELSRKEGPYYIGSVI